MSYSGSYKKNSAGGSRETEAIKSEPHTPGTPFHDTISTPSYSPDNITKNESIEFQGTPILSKNKSDLSKVALFPTNQNTNPLASTSPSSSNQTNIKNRPPLQIIKPAKMANTDYQCNVQYKFATGYLNMFKKDDVGKWFDVCVQLYTDAQVPEKTYLFDIITRCNSELSPGKEITWNPNDNRATVRNKLTLKFKVNSEDRLRKITDPECWKKKLYVNQLKDLKRALGNNYQDIQEILINRTPDVTKVLAYTKWKALEQDASKNDEERLSELAAAIDEYQDRFPSKNSVCNIANFEQDTASVAQNFMQQTSTMMQHEEMMRDMSNKMNNIISSIEKIKLESNNPTRESDNHRRENNSYRSNRPRYNETARPNNNRSTNNNWRRSNGGYNQQNYHNNGRSNERYSGNNSNRNYSNRNSFNNYQQNTYQNSRRPAYNNNLCSEHYCRGNAANMRYCQPGCRYHQSRICYAHWKFGSNAWQSKCGSFCQYFAGGNQNNMMTKNDEGVVATENLG